MTSTLFNTTIAALATGQGPAAVAVIRLSGSDAWHIARQLFQPSGSKFTGFKHGQVSHGWLLNAQKALDQKISKEIASSEAAAKPLDEVLLLPFKAPKSFTGEDIIEIHSHGGPLLSRLILAQCFALGAVPATPGEFTQRALLNGKLDLTQAESILDLISASSERLLRLAAGNLKARHLGQAIESLIQPLLSIQAKLVACVDFPDEVDEPDRQVIQTDLKALQQQVQALLAASAQNRLLREGFPVALLGQPNAGKSSLFNALLLQERAIVTDIAGTTRDVLSETLQIDGIAVTLLDTAGLRKTSAEKISDEEAPDSIKSSIQNSGQSLDPVEAIGIDRAWQAAQGAMAVLYLVDSAKGPDASANLNQDEAILAELGQTIPSEAILRLANKADLPETICPEGFLPVSAHSGQGLPQVLDWLSARLKQCLGQAADDEALQISLTHRQWGCLQTVQEQLAEAIGILKQPQQPIDLVTVPLTEALRSLENLLGRDSTEDVLTAVFSRFCVGK